jgi:hypothetical protein
MGNQSRIENELQRNIINAYEDVAKTSDELIKLQKMRIEELEEEATIHKETIERLITLLDETIAIAKSQIDKNILPKPTLN